MPPPMIATSMMASSVSKGGLYRVAR